MAQRAIECKTMTGKQAGEGPVAAPGGGTWYGLGNRLGEGPGNEKRPGKIHGSLKKVPLVQSFKEGQTSSSEKPAAHVDQPCGW